MERHVAPGIRSLTAAGGCLRGARARPKPLHPARSNSSCAFTAGGTTDLFARILAAPLSERLGQQVVIENKPGGGTNIAMQLLVNSAPDGHTLAMTFATNTINPSLYKSLPFDYQRDIAPVSGLADLPLVLVVNKDMPVKDVDRLHRLRQGQSGQGQLRVVRRAHHQPSAIELLKSSTGIDVVHVPYTGGPQIITDLISGQIEAGMDAPAEFAGAYPQRRGARARAMLSPQRNPAVPDVPAMSEIIPGIEINAGTGIGVPAATPVEIVERLNRDINACLADASLKARYADVGAVPIILDAGRGPRPGSPATPGNGPRLSRPPA